MGVIGRDAYGQYFDGIGVQYPVAKIPEANGALDGSRLVGVIRGVAPRGVVFRERVAAELGYDNPAAIIPVVGQQPVKEIFR